MTSTVMTIRGAQHVVTECPTCGVVHTIPKVVYDNLQREGGYYHCPNGHTWGWSKDSCERERLRRERDQLKQQIARVEDEKRAAVAQAESRAARAEAAQKLTERRARAALCPCCNRSFQNVARHMATKHKGVALMKAEKVSA